MLGLCMPKGRTYLKLTNGKLENIMISDESKPREHIMKDADVLDAVKYIGYKNVEAIIYEPDYHYNKRKTIVTMAEYYYEHGKELEGK